MPRGWSWPSWEPPRLPPRPLSNRWRICRLGEILTLEDAKRRREAARALGRRFVFTNGCFDIIHAGHTELLRKARSLGHYLLVGVNSDRSVRAIKGPGRPVQGEQARATVVSALASV